MALSQTSVLKLYNAVIDDVIAGVRDSFLDEGVDEQILQEMKQVWTNKLMASKAVEIAQEPPEPILPPATTNNTKTVSYVKANGTKSKIARNVTNAAAAAAAAQQQQTTSTPVATATTTPATTTTSNTSTTNNSNQSSFQNVVNGNQKQLQQIVQQQQQQQQQQHQQQQQQQQQQTAPPPPPAAVAGLDPNKIVPIQITLPAQAGVAGSELPRVLTIQVPASALQENQLHQVLTGPVITSIMPLPPHVASSVLQQHVNAALQNHAMSKKAISLQKQLDGAADTSDEDGSDVSDNDIDGDDDDDPDKDDEEEVDPEGGAEEEPLNSEDDVTDEDASDLFDTDNVVVCQYDKITRSRNKWKFYLKDGIMNIGGKDYVFQKSNGDAEW